ncbi:unnamed protein product [Caenorhabditis angaria]|uniref:Uncharacterized protein n=1 Tax=Caenorhabditis angaria TaxID=860376 RepID=A0A9P1J0V8_9PELO|nr:unnamed protein product [Caenorhabditis angaria]
MKLLLYFLMMVNVSNAFLWLPFANLGSMFETLKQSAFGSGGPDFNEPDSHSIFDFGRELFNGLGNLISSSFGDEEKMSLASNLREIFNLTTSSTKPTTKRVLPKIHPVDRPIPNLIPVRTTPEPIPEEIKSYTIPPSYLTTSTALPEITTTYDPRPKFRFSTTTEPLIVKFIKTSRTSTTTSTPSIPEELRGFTTKYATFAPNIQAQKTESTTTSKGNLFTKPAYPIWPTTVRSITPTPPTEITPEYPTTATYIKPSNVWKKITPEFITEHTTQVYTTEMPETTTVTTTTVPTTTTTEIETSSVTAPIPFIIKARKFTRPPINEKIVVTSSPLMNKYDTCQPDQRCSIKLRSFETSDPLFQYCYSHSTMIDDSIQDLLKETQTTVFPVHISWQQSVTPETIQLVQTLMSLYRPSRCLVVGVFTGIGLLGVAERVDSRGIVVALEHPAYAVFWEKVGQKHAKKLTTAQMSRIQMRTSESIEKSLPRLAANEPNTFDFIFMDDFKRENYLDNYEHSIRLLRSGGLLIINQALNSGGVMSPIDFMTNDDRVIRNMNIRIKQDARVSASLLPFGGGTWIITKN